MPARNTITLMQNIYIYIYIYSIIMKMYITTNKYTVNTVNKKWKTKNNQKYTKNQNQTYIKQSQYKNITLITLLEN